MWMRVSENSRINFIAENKKRELPWSEIKSTLKLIQMDIFFFRKRMKTKANTLSFHGITKFDWGCCCEIVILQLSLFTLKSELSLSLSQLCKPCLLWRNVFKRAERAMMVALNLKKITLAIHHKIFFEYLHDYNAKLENRLLKAQMQFDDQ